MIQPKVRHFRVVTILIAVPAWSVTPAISSHQGVAT